MTMKRNILAYGAEEGDAPASEQSEPTRPKGRERETARPPAETLLRKDAPNLPFDATPFPETARAQERIGAVRNALPDTAELHRLAENLKALSDPTRLTILNALYIAEMRVGELAEAVSMSQSAVSHQLRVLRAAQLVAVRREGKNAWYKLADPNLICLIRPAIRG
ncbi:MAG: ArsR/SmtB family transcription factor [Oceanidesulfovibrio sp.]